MTALVLRATPTRAQILVNAARMSFYIKLRCRQRYYKGNLRGRLQ